MITRKISWEAEFKRAGDVPSRCHAFNKSKTDIVTLADVTPNKGLFQTKPAAEGEWVKSAIGRGNEIHVTECFTDFARAKKELITYHTARLKQLTTEVNRAQMKLDKAKNMSGPKH